MSDKLKEAFTEIKALAEEFMSLYGDIAAKVKNEEAKNLLFTIRNDEVRSAQNADKMLEILKE